MRGSLYGKIRPHAEISATATSFKVMKDSIESRVTKTEFQNAKSGGTNLYRKKLFTGSGATATYNELLNEWTLSFAEGTGSWRGLRYTGSNAVLKPGDTAIISYDVYADFAVTMRVDVNNYASGVAGNDNDDMTLRKVDGQATVPGKWVRHSVRYTMKQAAVDPKEYYDGSTIAIDSSHSITAGQIVKIRNIQIEIGMFETGYSPNAEDVAAEIKTLESTLTQEAGKISLVVKEVSGQNKIDGNALVSSINAEPDSIKIASKNVNITGAVTFSSLASSLLSSVAEEGDAINKNPYFTDWPDNRATPAGYAVAPVGAAVTRLVEAGQKGNILRFNVAAASQNYLTPDNVTNYPYSRYVSITTTFRVNSGSTDLKGAGVMVRVNGSTIMDRAMSFLEEVGTPVLGRWYTCSKIIDFGTDSVPAGFTGIQSWPMAAWASNLLGASSASVLTAKVIDFAEVYVRPASRSEMDTYLVTTKEGGQTVIDGGKIKTNSIDANSIIAGSITTRELTVSQLSAISANMGTVNAGTLNVGGGVVVNSAGITATRGSQVVKMNSTDGFVITNGSTKMFEVDTSGNITAQSLRLVSGTMEGSTENMIRNTRFADYTNHWSLTAPFTFDFTTLFEGAYSLRFAVTGLTSDVWNGAYSEFVEATPNETYTASAYIMLSDVTSLDKGFTVELEFFNASNARITAIGSTVLSASLTNNAWKRIVTTAIAPAGTVKVRMRTNVVRNGTGWMAKPMLQHGSVVSEHRPHVTDVVVESGQERGISFRYIRDWLAGSTMNTSRHWVSIEAYVRDGPKVVDIAKTKTVMAGGPGGAGSDLARVTNGSRDTYVWATTNTPTNNEPTYVIVDLGAVRSDVEYLQVFHYYADGRRYYKTKTEVSVDGVAWFPLFDSRISGEYVETSAGKKIVVNPHMLQARTDESVTAVVTTENNTTVIDGGSIKTNSINASSIVAGSITTRELTVSQLSSITANIGNITSGTINVGGGVVINNTGVTATNGTTGVVVKMNSTTGFEILKNGTTVFTVDSLGKLTARDITIIGGSITWGSAAGQVPPPTANQVGAAVASDITNAVSAINIGGRNLLRNSGRLVSTSSYGMTTYPLTEPIVAGTQVTISMKASLGAGKKYFGLYNSGGMVVVASLYPAHMGSDGVFRATVNWAVGAASNTELTVYHMDSSTTATSTIEWVKLEYGNKATDWSPAPEDFSTGIKSVTDQVDAWKAPGTTEINGNSIRTGTLNAAKITTGTMSADRLGAGTIDANIITVRNLSASNITGGTLHMDRIAAGAIRADKLTIGSTENLVELVPGITYGSHITWQSSGNYWHVENVAEAVFPRMPLTNQMPYDTPINLRVRAKVFPGASQNYQILVHFYDAAGTWLAAVNTPDMTPSNDARESVISNVRILRTYKSYAVSVRRVGTPAGVYGLDTIEIRQMNAGSLIVDGTIEGSYIKSNAVTTRHLLINGVNLLSDVDSFEQFKTGTSPLGSTELLSTCAVSEEFAYHGMKSLKTVSSGANSYKYLHPTSNTGAGWIELKAGRRYVISAYVRTTSTAATTVNLVFVPREGKTSTTVTGTTTASRSIVASDGWVRVSAASVAVGGTNPFGSFYVRNVSSGITTYWDAIQIEEVAGDGTDPGSFCPGGVTSITGDSIRTGTIDASQMSVDAVRAKTIRLGWYPADAAAGIPEATDVQASDGYINVYGSDRKTIFSITDGGANASSLSVGGDLIMTGAYGRLYADNYMERTSYVHPCWTGSSPALSNGVDGGGDDSDYNVGNLVLYVMGQSVLKNIDGVRDGTKNRPFTTIQEAIDSVPKMLDHDVVIRVFPFRYEEDINIEGFTGRGVIDLRSTIWDIEYVNDLSNGSNINTGDHWTKVMLFGAVPDVTVGSRLRRVRDCSFLNQNVGATTYEVWNITTTGTTGMIVDKNRPPMGSDTVTANWASSATPSSTVSPGLEFRTNKGWMGINFKQSLTLDGLKVFKYFADIKFDSSGNITSHNHRAYKDVQTWVLGPSTAGFTANYTSGNLTSFNSANGTGYAAYVGHPVLNGCSYVKVWDNEWLPKDFYYETEFGHLRGAVIGGQVRIAGNSNYIVGVTNFHVDGTTNSTRPGIDIQRNSASVSINDTTVIQDSDSPIAAFRNWWTQTRISEVEFVGANSHVAENSYFGDLMVDFIRGGDSTSGLYTTIGGSTMVNGSSCSYSGVKTETWSSSTSGDRVLSESRIRLPEAGPNVSRAASEYTFHSQMGNVKASSASYLNTGGIDGAWNEERKRISGTASMSIAGNSTMSSGSYSTFTITAKTNTGAVASGVSVTFTVTTGTGNLKVGTTSASSSSATTLSVTTNSNGNASCRVFGTNTGTSSVSGNVRATATVSSTALTVNKSATVSPSKKLVTKTKTYTASSSESWHVGAGVWNGNYTGRDVIQGSWSGNTFRGVWLFGSTMSNECKNFYSIEKVRLYVTRNSGGYSSAQSAAIHWHGYTSRPSGSPSLSSAGASISLATGSSGWVEMPSAIRTSLKSGTVKGFGLQSSGGYFRGGGSLKVEVTYKVYENI